MSNQCPGLCVPKEVWPDLILGVGMGMGRDIDRRITMREVAI